MTNRVALEHTVNNTYIYQRYGWPDFQWEQDVILTPLAALRYKQGKLTGRMSSLGFSLRSEAMLEAMTLELIKSNEIEGERLDQSQVRSSIARRLGIDTFGLVAVDREVEGIVDMLLNATQQFEQPLTKDRLGDWHAALFPTGRSGMHKITVGDRRNGDSGPMQVVSGPIGYEVVHFQAPDAGMLDIEMSSFLMWFNARQQLDPVLKAAIAHL